MTNEQIAEKYKIDTIFFVIPDRKEGFSTLQGDENEILMPTKWATTLLFYNSIIKHAINEATAKHTMGLFNRDRKYGNLLKSFSRLEDKCKAVEAENARLREALGQAIEAVESMPDDCLGVSYDEDGDPEFPYKAQYLSEWSATLNQERTE